MASGLFEIRVVVTSSDAAYESEVVRVIASEFLRNDVQRVTVIAGDQHVNYVDGEVFNVTAGDLFRTNPQAPVDSFVCGHIPTSLN